MNFLLSIFLCLAMAVCGVGSPAELPDTAVTWTLSNLAIELGGDELALDPQVAVTVSISEDQAALHFELESGGQALLPVSAALTKDALLASFGSGERAYTLTEDEFLKMAEIEGPEGMDVLALLDSVGEEFIRYGGLIGSVRGDPAKALALAQTVAEALIDSCGSLDEDIEIEVDGETLIARHRRLTVTMESFVALLDELRGCDVPEIADVLNWLLDFGNSQADTDYASFTEALTSEGELEENFAWPIDITSAETDELKYIALGYDMSVEGAELQFSEEMITRGEETTGTVDCRASTSSAPAVTLDEHADITMTGPVNAPTATQVEMDVSFVSEAASEDAYDQSSGTNVAAHISMRNEESDGLRSGSFIAETSTIQDETATPVTFTAEYAERAEGDGSVTNAVSLSVGQLHMEIARLSFDLNRSGAPAEDFFDGLDEIPITAGMMADEAGDSLEMQMLMSSAMADVSQAYLDVIKLQQDPSVQELVNYFAQFADAYAVFTGTSVIGGADGPTGVYITED